MFFGGKDEISKIYSEYKENVPPPIPLPRIPIDREVGKKTLEVDYAAESIVVL
ncbi:MAG: hypothetical protein RMJ15_08865 [Nitrososphaerota archaeon]|nr:hypothetical protein [Candidatus Bathyarchaeota archaeon]MDW8023829.1 hypothetical protein [Nitrososphaerota archaeon]